MQAETAPSKNSTTRVKPSMPWRVAKVEVLPAYQIKVTFLDGTEGLVDMAKLVSSPKAGVFSELADPSVFNQVYVDLGVVTWPGEIDLAPDAMYQAIKKNGKWILR